MTARTRSTRRAIALAACGVALSLSAQAAHHEEGEHAEHGAATSGAAAAIPRTPRPAEATLYLISPRDGETVSGPVTVRFGLSGMGVAPAGVATPNTGHHHLLIDAPLPPTDAPIPADDNHRHFGGGQTEVSLELPPGKHTLQLLAGDQNHMPHDPPLYSEVVTITVE